MVAMAEVLWSSDEGRDFKEFTGRLRDFYPVLDALEVHYGAEAIPFRHKMILEEGRSYLHLHPYSEDIEVRYSYTCSDCDSSERPYKEPILLDANGKVHIQAYRDGAPYGDPHSVPLHHHLGIDAEVEYATECSDWYTAGGPKGLVDGKLGGLNFRDGSWQGFWGNDLECILRLDSNGHSFQKVSARFYQYTNSWILLPRSMRVYSSNDGINWTLLDETASAVDPARRGKFIQAIQVESESMIEAEYIKLEVENYGPLPDWHEAAGADAWIFIDEIMIE
jgi:hexosaminidase